MGKHKKNKPERAAPPKPAARDAPPAPPDPQPADPGQPAAAPGPTPAEPVRPPASGPPPRPRPPAASRWRRLAPDLVKAALALGVIGFGGAIWYEPPLLRADFPRLTYATGGETRSDAALYRPLAMPTRYYIELPRTVAGRYTWFAVDRRREVAALAEPPARRFLGQTAVRRGDPLGLDLEFRKLDGSEWQVHFYADAIVFSNAVLALRLDARPPAR